MNDRIHRAYDGELELADLTPEEREQLALLTATVEDLAQALQEAPAPDLSTRVMAALPAGSTPETAPVPASPFRWAADWLWRPRELAFAWRPVHAFVVLLLLLGGAELGRRTVGYPGQNARVVGATDPPVVFVQFRLEAPGAASVELAGSFTNWDSAVSLVETTPGVWSTLVALEPGVHDYAFVVDGQSWVADPMAPSVDDGFGGTNSRLFLTRPGGNV